MSSAPAPSSIRQAQDGSGQAPLHRPEAVAIARAFVSAIEDATDQLVVGGSLRRRLAWVSDIEVVAVPKMFEATDGLFGDVPVRVNHLEDRLQAMLDHGEVDKRRDRHGVTRWGPTLKYLSFQGAKVDLFSPGPQRFGWILLLRTGPAAFSRQLVVPRGKRTKDDRPGLLPPTVLPRDGWLTDKTSGQRIETPTERDAFRVLGLDWIEPWERT